jgi:hypothetical protein
MFRCRLPLRMRTIAPPPRTRNRFLIALFVLVPTAPALRLPQRTGAGARAAAPASAPSRGASAVKDARASAPAKSARAAHEPARRREAIGEESGRENFPT